jgi:uncharacterized protein (DUF1501 family)
MRAAQPGGWPFFSPAWTELGAFETGLGPRWKDTAILVVSEFGRPARINGTTGTDHGNGAVAILAGGAIKGAVSSPMGLG